VEKAFGGLLARRRNAVGRAREVGNTMLKKLLLAGAAIALATGAASAKELNSIGITLGTLGNPFFVALAAGAEAKAKEINPNVTVNTADANYDLNKQFNQIDNFIASGVDMILLNAADPKAIAPAVKRAQAAGIVVVAVDVAAAGADATVQTNNVQAGQIACQYIADKLGAEGGQVIIQNGPQVGAVLDRVQGCKEVLAKNPKIEILSDDQDGKGSREGGLNIMQGHLTRFPEIDAVFTINDPQAVGSDLAAKQLGRSEFFIVSVDGAPDIETALQRETLVQASASQDPYAIAQKGVEIGYQIMNGEKPENPMILLPSTLITRDNVKDYQGWSAPR
jgi:ribose transport system substrate-binding protein